MCGDKSAVTWTLATVSKLEADRLNILLVLNRH